ncbi:hypothetical protein RchiOBHm_Chr7g0182151 [Rosa chinensis]|uniref:Uncharacterized protein n=1 Tax=Rosa chinensis TaxID=74649 RepID=A0A2P6P2T5_ROSCH|nr:hypothetical protein RchiOBHm_Chr7g0182151 [Rosa chinensis]
MPNSLSVICFSRHQTTIFSPTSIFFPCLPTLSLSLSSHCPDYDVPLLLLLLLFALFKSLTFVNAELLIISFYQFDHLSCFFFIFIVIPSFFFSPHLPHCLPHFPFFFVYNFFFACLHTLSLFLVWCITFLSCFYVIFSLSFPSSCICSSTFNDQALLFASKAPSTLHVPENDLLYLVFDLVSAAFSEPPGGWSSLHKLAVLLLFNVNTPNHNHKPNNHNINDPQYHTPRIYHKKKNLIFTQAVDERTATATIKAASLQC